MTKKKSEPIDGTNKAHLALENIPHYDDMATTGQATLDAVKLGPNFNSDPPVESAVALMQTCVNNLNGTLSGLDQARKTIAVLEPQRVLDAAALHRANDNLETTITTSTGGMRKGIVAYGAKLVGATPSILTTDPPTLVRGKSTPGSFAATLQCKADSRAICYHYAWGTDPTNPDAFPGTAIEGGAKYKIPGPLPVGQKLYARIAVQRRKTGLGKWSDLVEVTIR
jgi:hypothetical protein